MCLWNLFKIFGQHYAPQIHCIIILSFNDLINKLIVIAVNIYTLLTGR